jgi:uncharacterized protein with HEPN domain
MTLHDDTVALCHMRDHVAEALELSRGRQRHDLESDRMFALALTKLVEIVGEAAARVSTETQLQHPAIPWRQIVGTRNRLVHGYDAVDLDILWRIATDELGELLSQLQSILAVAAQPGDEPAEP